MYKLLPTLNLEKTNQLKDLFSSVEFTNKDRRLGNSGLDKMSIYNYSKWKSWNRHDVQKFKQAFEQNLVEKSLIGWFLEFPADTGFLDLMTTWVGKDCGIISAFSLVDNQSIWLDGEEVNLKQGEGIEFSLSIPHEVKQSAARQQWACLMSLR